jgi:HNH endonuclease
MATLSKTAAMARFGATFKNVRWSWDARRWDGAVIFIAWDDEVVLGADGALVECRLAKTLDPTGKILGARERQVHLDEVLASGGAGYVVLATAKDRDADTRSIATMSDRLYSVRLERREAAVYGVALGVDTAPVASEDADAAVTASARAFVEPQETERRQLVLSRRGQGLFRARVDALEAACRVTGVADRGHLRASHIKPWRVATDAERLDGDNGLFLAPHVDHLFDRGYISFDDEGRLLVSPLLALSVVRAWGIDTSVQRPVREAQRGYLAYHRASVFRRTADETTSVE